MAHENAYLAHLKAQGVSILNLRDIDDSERALGQTREAMESGVEAIAQATLANGRWFGRSDVASTSREGQQARRPKAERVGEIAVKAAVQLLFSTGKSSRSTDCAKSSGNSSVRRSPWKCGPWRRSAT